MKRLPSQQQIRKTAAALTSSEIGALSHVKGRVAIITGGAGMLGTEYARVLAGAGARVALFDILSAVELGRRAAAIGKDVIGISLDVSNERAVQKAVAAVKKKFGSIDIVINNAALTDFSSRWDRFSPYESFPTELWDKEIDVTLGGAFRVTKAVLPHLMRQKSGVIVNIASMYGFVGPDNRIYPKGKFRSIAYAAAKSGMYNFTRALASYLAPYHVRVNTLTLGGVRSGQDRRFLRAYAQRSMMNRMLEREEVRGPMLFLCSDASSAMTGANLVVDGGWSAW